MTVRAKKYILLATGLALWLFAPYYMVHNLGQYAWPNAETYYSAQAIPLLIFAFISRNPATIGGFATGISIFIILFWAYLSSFHSPDASLGWALYPFSLPLGLLISAVVAGIRSERLRDRPLSGFFISGVCAFGGFLIVPVTFWGVFLIPKLFR